MLRRKSLFTMPRKRRQRNRLLGVLSRMSIISASTFLFSPAHFVKNPITSYLLEYEESQDVLKGRMFSQAAYISDFLRRRDTYIDRGLQYMMEPNTPDFLSRTERRKILQEFDLNPLRNKGGICVINSTLQCILASKVLCDKILHISKDKRFHLLDYWTFIYTFYDRWRRFLYREYEKVARKKGKNTEKLLKIVNRLRELVPRVMTFQMSFLSLAVTQALSASGENLRFNLDELEDFSGNNVAWIGIAQKDMITDARIVRRLKNPNFSLDNPDGSLSKSKLPQVIIICTNSNSEQSCLDNVWKPDLVPLRLNVEGTEYRLYASMIEITSPGRHHAFACVYCPNARKWIFLSDDHFGMAPCETIRGSRIFFYQCVPSEVHTQVLGSQPTPVTWRQRLASLFK